MKIVGFGDYLIHFSPIGDERFAQANIMEISFTGAEANVCAALSEWGLQTEFVTRLPDHALAKKGIGFLKSLNIITDNIPVSNHRMGTYYLENGRSLRPSGVIYDRDNSSFTTSTYDDYNWDKILENADILYLTGITPTLSESLCDCTYRLAKEAHRRNMKIFFDINYRPTLSTPEKSSEIISPLLPFITHLIGNEEHIKMIFGISSEYGEDETEKRLNDISKKTMEYTGINNIAVTVRRTISSSETVIYSAYREGEAFAMSPVRRVPVIDRVGSGDAFSAGLVYGISNGYSPKDAVDFAAASCAFKHTVARDINFSTVDEIKNLAKSGSCDVKR